MGTVRKSVLMITDVYVNIRHSLYIDAEDWDFCDNLPEESTQNAISSNDTAIREQVQNEMRAHILDHAKDLFSELSFEDIQDTEIDWHWNWREIEVCEWCGSPSCEGEPSDCTEAPEWCWECNEAVDNCSCEEDAPEIDPESIIYENTDVKKQIEKILADASEVESIL